MARNIQTEPRWSRHVEAWPPDDTEESILGIELHQATITIVRWGINETAGLSRKPGEAIPWGATSQLVFLGCKRPDGSAYRTYPDVFVFPRAINPFQGPFSLRDDGAPLLVIEVLSESTYQADLDLARGKGYSYAQAGVREYLTLDPTGNLLPEGIRAWRLRDGAYRSWQAGKDGRWHSEQIAAAFGLEGLLAGVYGPDGNRMLREGEVERTLSHERQRRAAAEVAAGIERERLTAAEAEIERLRRLLGLKNTE